MATMLTPETELFVALHDMVQAFGPADHPEVQDWWAEQCHRDPDWVRADTRRRAQAALDRFATVAQATPLPSLMEACS